MNILPQPIFNIYALSRPRGLGFGNDTPIGAWINEGGSAWGYLLAEARERSFSYAVFRRRPDQVWSETHSGSGFSTKAEAYAELEAHAKEPGSIAIPPGSPRRPLLADAEDRTPSDVFRSLARKSHHAAAWTLNQLYLALPRPDPNWASDCQTQGFHTRLWEAHLLGCLREQGLLVSQPQESPDFRIEDDLGQVAWIEAVTANPSTPYNHYNAPPSEMPVGREALFFGPAALRFAKTLGNKLARGYDELPQVAGQPFVLAIADFQSSASMLWSREGLIGYLYGMGARVAEVDGLQRAEPVHAEHLLDESQFPAGLFVNARCAQLSAVLFSNACSISKLYRVPVSGGAATNGFRYTRCGEFFDRTEGALKGIPFCLDITSEDYRILWPQGYEPWSAELEVFHNPFAKHPFPMDMLPKATHWFDQDGEQVCRSGYETSILWSKTIVNRIEQRAPTLQNILRDESDREVDS